MEAKLKEKDEATASYDDAIASGGGAFLMETSETRKDAFKVSVGNLPPKREALLEMTYVTEATVEDSTILFTMPGSKLTLGEPDLEGEFASEFPTPFSVRVTLGMFFLFKWGKRVVYSMGKDET